MNQNKPPLYFFWTLTRMTIETAIPAKNAESDAFAIAPSSPNSAMTPLRNNPAPRTNSPFANALP